MPATLSPSEAIDRLNDAAHQATSNEKAAALIGTAKTRLVLSKDARSVFFASLVMRLKFEPDWTVKTAATDGRRIVYNPDFVIGLTEPELIGTLAHEVLHCTNKHFARRGERDPEQWNIACDLAINPLLIESRFDLPAGALLPGIGQYSEMPDGMSAEEYFAALTQPEPTGDESGAGGSSDESGSPDAGQDDSPGDDQADDGSTDDDTDDQAGSPGDAPGACDPGQCGGVMDPTNDEGQPAEPADQKQLDQEWTVNTAAAQQAAQRRGELPAGLDRLCQAVLTPAVDWKTALREFITRPAKRDYNWRRPSRRYIHRGLYLPSLHSLEIGHIVAAIDCSGSITESNLARFAAELNDIASQAVCQITILYHDSDVCKVQEWTPDEGPLTLEMCGGGGTDHCPIFEWIDQNTEEPPAVLVCLTDLYSTFPPAAPEYPTLWVSTEPRQPHPFGDRLDIPAV